MGTILLCRCAKKTPKNLQVLEILGETAPKANSRLGCSLIGVDLSRAEILDKDYEARRATIRLPPPEVMQARVDHQRTKTWQVSRMAWLPWNADQDGLRDSVMLQAQQLVAQAAGSAESIQQAKAAAAAIIAGFFNEVGWRVEVTWAAEAVGRP